jgi:hypothetical protein
MNRAGPETKYYSAGEAQQQFTGQIIFVAMIVDVSICFSPWGGGICI